MSPSSWGLSTGQNKCSPHRTWRSRGQRTCRAFCFPVASLCDLGGSEVPAPGHSFLHGAAAGAEDLAGVRAGSSCGTRHLCTWALSAETFVCLKEGVLTSEALATPRNLLHDLHPSSDSPRGSGELTGVASLLRASVEGPAAGRHHRARRALCLPADLTSPSCLFKHSARDAGRGRSSGAQSVGTAGQWQAGVWVRICLSPEPFSFPGEILWETLSG